MEADSEAPMPPVFMHSSTMMTLARLAHAAGDGLHVERLEADQIYHLRVQTTVSSAPVSPVQ